MPHLHHGALGSSAGWLVTFAIVLTATVYLRGWFELRSTSFRIKGSWRAFSFFVGLFLIWVAVASPLAALDHELLSVHMLQHLLLMTLAPALLWLGAPVNPLLHALPQPLVQYALAQAFRWPLVRKAGGALGRPEFCWLAACAALLGWHVPKIFAFAMQSATWHMVEQASFLLTGLLFWWPVVQPWPSASKPGLSIIIYLFLATLPCDILSGFLVFCDRVIYPMYLSSSHLFGFSALEDQQCAAALMWTCVTVVYFIAGAILTMQLLSPQSLDKDHWVQSEMRRSGIPQGSEAV